MSEPLFHLAFPVSDLEATRRFYRDTLGCAEGRSAERWIDFDFYGHQISAHLVSEHLPLAGRNDVEAKQIPIPHFGLILTLEAFRVLEERLSRAEVNFVHPPFVRFAGLPGEQRSMFVEDPSGNVLEFKAFADRKAIFTPN